MDSYAELARAATPDKHDLDTEWERHVNLVQIVGERLVKALSARDKLKLDIDNASIDIELKVRKRLEDGKEKLTEGAIKNKVESDPKLRALNDELHAAKEEAARWQALDNTYKQRSYSLKYLSDLYFTNYFTRDSARVSADENIKTVVADRIRKEAAQVRKSKRTVREDDD